MRDALNSRGWVAKFENMTSLTLKKRVSTKEKYLCEEQNGRADADDTNEWRR